MGLFGPSIDYELKLLDDRDIHGAIAESDFTSRRELKRHVKNFIAGFNCPHCGNHRISGSGLIVEYGKVHLFESVEYKGWFGGRKTKDKKHSTAWRMHDIVLRNAPGRALLNLFAVLDPPPGELTCESRGCDWKIKGQRGETWSINDILRSIPQ